jgi:hypothetical protein
LIKRGAQKGVFGLSKIPKTLKNSFIGQRSTTKILRCHTGNRPLEITTVSCKIRARRLREGFEASETNVNAVLAKISYDGLAEAMTETGAAAAATATTSLTPQRRPKPVGRADSQLAETDSLRLVKASSGWAKAMFCGR